MRKCVRLKREPRIQQLGLFTKTRQGASYSAWIVKLSASEPSDVSHVEQRFCLL